MASHGEEEGRLVEEAEALAERLAESFAGASREGAVVRSEVEGVEVRSELRWHLDHDSPNARYMGFPDESRTLEVRAQVEDGGEAPIPALLEVRPRHRDDKRWIEERLLHPLELSPLLSDRSLAEGAPRGPVGEWLADRAFVRGLLEGGFQRLTLEGGELSITRSWDPHKAKLSAKEWRHLVEAAARLIRAARAARFGSSEVASSGVGGYRQAGGSPPPPLSREVRGAYQEEVAELLAQKEKRKAYKPPPTASQKKWEKEREESRQKEARQLSFELLAGGALLLVALAVLILGPGACLARWFVWIWEAIFG